VTDYNGFGSSAPGNLTWQNDSGAYTFGQKFRVTSAGLSATKIRFYLPAGSPNGAGAGFRVALYAVGNTTPLATAGPTSFAVGWNEVVITSTALTSGADYMAAVLVPAGYYGADSVLFAGGDYDPSGPLYFLSAGSYNASGTLTYPTSTFGTPWYGVDVTVSDGASSNDGSGTAASGTTAASGAGSVGMDGTGTAAAEASTASGTGSVGMDGSGTAASGVTAASGSGDLPANNGSGTAAGRATTAVGYGTGPVGGFAGDRAELVALLATIPGVVALPYPNGVPARGQAWPLLGSIDLSSYGEANWHVVFVAGGDGRTAERWLDDNLSMICDALRPFMYVDTVSPVDLGNNVVGVEFAGRKEI
jgi:hypothetical protein